MSKLYEVVKAFFEKEKIEYFSPIEFKDCTIINASKLRDFCPKSAVMFLIPYKTGDYPERNVSLYSVSRDYHLYARELEERLKAFMENESAVFRTFCDSSPINERDAAIKACLGVRGKNGLVINEKYGSFVFIGTLLTDGVFDKEEYSEVKNKAPECIGCRKCIDVCGYLSGKESTCFSELTQRKKVSDDELAAIKSDKIRWGCDRCQEVCPMNEAAKKTPIDFFYEDTIPFVTEEYILSAEDEKFCERAYSWRGKEVILRNIRG